MYQLTLTPAAIARLFQAPFDPIGYETVRSSHSSPEVMLERASSCLESGGRQFLRKTKRCPKSRQVLHSKLWHHAAGALGLPIWWASAASTDATSLAQDPSYGRASQHRHDGGMSGQGTMALDFLYPAKTLAFIQHISTLGWGGSNERRKQHSLPNGIRHFSSKSGHIQEFTNLEADVSLTQEMKEVDDLLKDTDALEALRGLLQSSDHRRDRVVWRLYELVDNSDRTVSLRADLLDHLAASAQSADAYRLLQIFESLVKEDRRASSYHAAISAYLRLNMVGTAMRIHEEAAAHVSEPKFGSDILLARTIQDNQWDLAFKVQETFASSSANSFHANELSPETSSSSVLWSVVRTIHDLPGRSVSLLQYAEQFAHDLLPTSARGKKFDLFAREFFPLVIQRALQSDDPNDDVLRGLFVGLKNLGLSRHGMYTLAIQMMLQHPKYQQYSNRRKLHIELYSMFRQDALNESARSFRAPPVSLIRALMNHLTAFHSYEDRTGAMTTVDSLVGDLRRFHSENRMMFSRHLNFVMAMYARAGDAEKVYQYFAEFREIYAKTPTAVHRRPRINQRTLWPLLYVHARRVEVSATLEQFQRISAEFGLTPDERSWNILLLVYARADDLEGILNCFDDFLASGLPPTIQSFLPVLDVCARRGDVDHAEGLLSKAQSLNVDLETSTVARQKLVLAHINNDDLPTAEEVAEKMIMDKREGRLSGSLTLTLNYLITAYVQRQDVNSTRRIYKRYKEERIRMDSLTYAALMQALILMRQTNSAYKILTTTMPNNNVQGYAFHYALCIAGFLGEGQLFRAQDVQNRMLRRKIPHSPSSRIACLKIKALVELETMKAENPLKAKYRLPRLEDAEEELRQLLFKSDPSERSPRQPRQGLHLMPLNQAVPDGYFEFLVMVYGTHGAYSLCKETFESAAMYRQGNSESFEASLSLLTAVMEGHQRAGEHTEVDKCWELARTHAARSAEMAQDIRHPSSPEVPSSKISPARSHMLVRPTRIYFRDLAKRQGTVSIGKMRLVVSSLLQAGYKIDNLTWNEYVQYLARTGYMLDAFTTCEAYLMPVFKGWRFAAPHYLRRDPDGYLRMDLRTTDTRKDIIMPRYKTLVIMAAALGYIRRQEAMGVEPQSLQQCSLRTLRKSAPKTIRAIETMPIIPADRLQKAFLMGPRAL